MFVAGIKCKTINNFDMLLIVGEIAQHVEELDIILRFSSKLRLENISDDIVINLLDNIENRL